MLDNRFQILNGMWQVFGAYGIINPTQAIASRFRYWDAGLTTWDLAEHYILEQPSVAGALIGARLSVTEHIADNAKVFQFKLNSEDYQRIKYCFQLVS